MKNEMPKSDAGSLKAGKKTNAETTAICFKAAVHPKLRSDSTGISGQCEQMAHMQSASSPTML